MNVPTSYRVSAEPVVLRLSLSLEIVGEQIGIFYLVFMGLMESDVLSSTHNYAFMLCRELYMLLIFWVTLTLKIRP